ncbi:MAG: histidine phosphatase family protein [Bdellovibrionaceae bacterium]|nr:histidine phosphatase family protein [Pseudobdellovibrionaceae bacterium]
MNPTKKTFYLIRHGQTDWNLQKRLQGSHDIPLNETGREQARVLQPFFDNHKIDLLCASPLGRAQETLRLIFPNWNGKAMVIEEHLREVNLGPLEGRMQADVEQEFGLDTWKKWMEVPEGSEDFAYDGAETPRQSNARLKKCLLKIAGEHPFETAAVCIHGFLLRRFIQDISPVQPSRVIPNGLIMEIECDLKNETFALKEIFQVLEEKRY